MTLQNCKKIIADLKKLFYENEMSVKCYCINKKSVCPIRGDRRSYYCG